MFYSGWKFQVPQSLDLSTANGGQVVSVQHSVHPTATGGVSTLSFLSSPRAAASRSSALRPAPSPDPRRRPFHLKSDAALAPASGLFYAEVQVLEVRSGGGRRAGLGLVVGLCARDLPAHRLPGEEARSVGFFASQRMVYRDGGREATRVGGGEGGPRRREIGEGDAVGCLVRFADGAVQFTVNGALLPGGGGGDAAAGCFFALGLQRLGCDVRLRVILQSGGGPPPPPPLLGEGEAPPPPTTTTTRFDVAAYGRQIAERKIRETRPRLFNGNWMESSFDDAAVAAILQQYFSSRGMTRASSALFAELAEMGVVSTTPPCAHSGSSEAEAVRIENGTEPTPHPLRSSSSFPDSKGGSNGVLATGNEARLPVIPGTTTLLEYTSEVETLRRLFMAPLSHSSALALSDLPGSQRLASKTAEPSHTRVPDFKDSRGAHDPAHGRVYPKETTDVLDYLMNRHHILSPIGRCALASLLNTTLDSLDSILPSRFWVLLFFSRRQDILFVIKALQIIDLGLDFVLRSLADLRRQFSPQQAQDEGILHDNNVKGKRSNYTESDNAFPTKVDGMFFSPFGMNWIQQRLLMHYANTVLKPFHDIKASEHAARQRRVHESLCSPGFGNGLTEPHTNPHQRRGETKNEEDCAPGASCVRAGVPSGGAGATTDACLLAHIRACRRVASASPAESGADEAPVPAAAPWEAVGEILLQEATPRVAPPSFPAQIALIQSLITVVVHAMAFFAHLLASVGGGGSGRGPQGGAPVRRATRGRRGRRRKSHPPKVGGPRAPALFAAQTAGEASVVALLGWAERWEALLGRARAQHHKSAWALLQHALDELNDRVRRRLSGLLGDGGRPRTVMAYLLRPDRAGAAGVCGSSEAKEGGPRGASAADAGGSALVDGEGDEGAGRGARRPASVAADAAGGLFFPLAQPPLRAVYRRAHAVASLKPQQRITTGAFLAALEGGLRGGGGEPGEGRGPEEAASGGARTPTGARASVARRTPPNAAPSAPSPSPSPANLEDDGAGGAHGEAAQGGGDWAVDVYYRGSIYLKRVYQHIFR